MSDHSRPGRREQVDYQVPRLALGFLLATQVLLLLPHLQAFPLILVPVWLVCTFWRLMIFRGRWGSPSTFVKTGLVVMSALLIVAVQGRALSLETAIVALLVSFLLKLLEMKQQRDMLVLVYLAYFVIIGQLLLSQDLLSGVYLLAGMLVVTATLIAMRSAVAEIAWYQPLLQSARMLAISVPVMLVAFLVFPRLEPLWMVPMPSGAGKTGVSGSMSPGQFSSLAQSDALAFRAGFEGSVPALHDLYWRGIVLTEFDGNTWRPLDEPGLPAAPVEDIDTEGNPQSYRYRITIEPTQQLWVFVLAGVTEMTADADYLRDFTIRAREKIDQRQAWQFTSFPKASLGREIWRYHRYHALQLPEGFNLQAQEFARRLRSQSSSQEDYIRRVLDHFRNENFVYTLSPPALGRHTVDEFLFGTRQGFCEHFASAFVVLMRAAGIPSRVVAGYQGGDINPYEKHVTVRQLDAHAWTEVWLDGKGWVTVDPTYAVAPERIENGSQQSLQQEEQFLAKNPLSPIRYRGLTWLTSLQYRFDQMNYLWHIWVLDYTGDRQQMLLLSFLGEITARRMAMLMGGAFLLFALFMAVYILTGYRRPSLSPADRIYRRFLRKLAAHGMQKAAAEGPLDFAARAKTRWPEKADAIDVIVRQYVLLNYVGQVGDQGYSGLLKQFRRDVISFKP